MRIVAVSSSQVTSSPDLRAGGARNTNVAGAAAPGAEAQLSPAARLLLTARAAYFSGLAQRSQRLDQLRDHLSSGRFQVDLEGLCDAVLQVATRGESNDACRV